MNGRRVLVTGSSRGIGAEIAARLAISGWQVALHYATRADEANAVANRIGEAAAGVYRADLSSHTEAAELFDKAATDGPIHALVNNAGVYLPLDFVGSDDAEFVENWRQTFSINFDATLILTRLAAQRFADHGGGRILNVASRVGFKGEGGAALYAASKAAMISLTRSLAVELAPKNVLLFGIAPGWVETAMARQGMDERLAEILSTIPLGRMGSPADCAATADFLLSEGASYLSGVVIDINGASYFH